MHQELTLGAHRHVNVERIDVEGSQAENRSGEGGLGGEVRRFPPLGSF
jgi:hypothetical protein